MNQEEEIQRESRSRLTAGPTIENTPGIVLRSMKTTKAEVKSFVTP